MTIAEDPMTIVHEVTIAAPATKIFAALTEPEQLCTWWGDDTTYRCTDMQRDLRVGGKWRANGLDAQGQPFAVEGTYRTIDAPRMLEYTWLYDWAPENSPETVVRFQLTESGGQTLVRLTHSGFNDLQSKVAHGEGWVRVIGWLRGYVE